jgi:steroid delta-isomerase-like uncharacterized protein
MSDIARATKQGKIRHYAMAVKRHPKQKGKHSMSPKENKAVMRRMLDEVIVGGNLDLMDELVHPDFANHNVVGTAEASSSFGVENFRQEIEGLRSAFPDIELDVIHLLADGDKVIAHLRGHGTHLGEFGGMPATGHRVDVPSITIVRFADGKFAERWNLVDRYGMLKQLGVFRTQ